jgi:hypothetical protein
MLSSIIKILKNSLLNYSIRLRECRGLSKKDNMKSIKPLENVIMRVLLGKYTCFLWLKKNLKDKCTVKLLK